MGKSRAEEQDQLHSINQPNITRKFPPGEPKRLAPVVLGGLLRNAMRTYLEIISRSEPRTFAREVFRLQDRGFYTVDIRFPDYGQWKWETVKTELDLKQA